MSPPHPEVRIDELTGLRTILAPARADRPFELSLPEGRRERPAECPFCEGNEDRTPPEVWADRPGGGEPDTPGWRVRAVPNLYPALMPGDAAEGEAASGDAGGLTAGADPLRAQARGAQVELFAATAATGSHEIVVHAPAHRTSMAELDEAELTSAIAGWRARMRAHSDSRYTQLIVNEGAGAGASLEHSHAQLYALGFVPAAVARERERFTSYNQRTMGGNLLADVGTEEVRRRERLVAIDDDAILICPWASHSPFQLRIVPRRPAPRFEEDDAGVGMLATALRALRERFGAPPELNAWVRTAPRGADPFCWRIDIAPRLTVKAGFELSTQVDINTYPPEGAAGELRDCL